MALINNITTPWFVVMLLTVYLNRSLSYVDFRIFRNSFYLYSILVIDIKLMSKSSFKSCENAQQDFKHNAHHLNY